MGVNINVITSGNGDGNGDGYGYGNGYGYGYGYGNGDGNGRGYGYGNGYGNGDGRILISLVQNQIVDEIEISQSIQTINKIKRKEVKHERIASTEQSIQEASKTAQ